MSDNKVNATSPSHCPCLQVADRELFQGNNLPPDQKQKAQERNWQQFKDKFGVYPEDYRKQQIDIENGGLRSGVGVFVKEQERGRVCVCVCVHETGMGAGDLFEIHFENGDLHTHSHTHTLTQTHTYTLTQTHTRKHT